MLSQFPHFVPAAWAALKPQISTRYAERRADLIRRAALVPGAPPPAPRPKLLANGWTPEQIAQVQSALHCLNYGNPKYLLLITAWNEAWNDRGAAAVRAVLSYAMRSCFSTACPRVSRSFT
ncbi:MAG: hypothetical protein ACRECQ_14960 [Burkholderiaceae bacterium]